MNQRLAAAGAPHLCIDEVSKVLKPLLVGHSLKGGTDLANDNGEAPAVVPCGVQIDTASHLLLQVKLNSMVMHSARQLQHLRLPANGPVMSQTSLPCCVLGVCMSQAEGSLFLLGTKETPNTHSTRQTCLLPEWSLSGEAVGAAYRLSAGTQRRSCTAPTGWYPGMLPL